MGSEGHDVSTCDPEKTIGVNQPFFTSSKNLIARTMERYMLWLFETKSPYHAADVSYVLPAGQMSCLKNEWQLKTNHLFS